MFSASYACAMAPHPTDPSKVLVKATIKAVTKHRRAPKHILLVTDISQSMRDKRLPLAKKALATFLGNVSAQDSVSLMTFAAEAKTLFHQIKGDAIDRPIGEGKPSPLQIIRDLESDSGTRLDIALEKIGTAECPIDDPENTIVVIATDGENRVPNFEKNSRETLQKRCGGKLPLILPIGISTDSPEESLRLLCHTGTGDPVEIFVNDAAEDPDAEIDAALNIAAVFLAEQTPEKVILDVTFGVNQKKSELGKLLNGVEAARVFEFTKPGYNPTLTIGSTLPGKKVEIKFQDIAKSRDVLADYVLDLYNAQLSRKKFNNQSQIGEEVKGLLALLPEDPDDSEYVKQVRDMLKNLVRTDDLATQREFTSFSSTSRLGARKAGAVTQALHRPASATAPALTAKQEAQTNTNAPVPQSWTIDYVKHEGPIVAMTSSKDATGILIEPADPWIISLSEKVSRKEKKGLRTTLENIVQTISEVDVQSLTASAQTTVQLDRSITCDSLQTAFQKTPTAAVCLAPLVAAVTADLVNQRMLPDGTVRQFKGFTLDGKHVHTFVTYKPKGGKPGAGPVVIDATNPKQTVFNLADPADRDELELSYEKRNLSAAVLDACYGAYGIASARPYKIADELIGKIKNQDVFMRQGYLCPITLQVPQTPVYIEGEENTVYERAAIETWVSIHHTSPLTRKPITEDDLQFALTARQAIIGLALEQSKNGVPDLRVAPPRKTRDQIRELVSQHKVTKSLPKIKLDEALEELKGTKIIDDKLMPFSEKVLIGLFIGLFIGFAISGIVASMILSAVTAAGAALVLLIQVAGALLGADAAALIADHQEKVYQRSASTPTALKALGAKDKPYRLVVGDDDEPTAKPDDDEAGWEMSVHAGFDVEAEPLLDPKNRGEFKPLSPMV